MLSSICIGCLPTLATIPVWIGLYQALSNVANEVIINYINFYHLSGDFDGQITHRKYDFANYVKSLI